MNAPLEKRVTTNMTSKGQVLIPKDVRDAIGLVPGQPVDVGINDRGEAVVTPGHQASSQTPDQRRARFMGALAKARSVHGTGRPTAEIVRDLRGDEPLP
jgi:antitoxin PrlF